MRPTGRLHIGHYFGALANWIKMQEEYDCFYFVADWHALTTDYADSSAIARNSIEIGTDWLAAGLDPAKCTMFVQSQLPDHAELHLLLSMVTPLGWLERVPTYKEQLEQMKEKDLRTYGFLGYPLLQAADIVMYGDPRAELLVPVGEDQVPHVELTREIVRRFNVLFRRTFMDSVYTSEPQIWRVLERPLVGPYAPLNPAPPSGEERLRIEAGIRQKILETGLDNFKQRNPAVAHFLNDRTVLQEPKVLLTETPKIPGTDGRKMSKSYDNYISLGESDDSIRARTKVMMTDPARKRREDPGNPDVCPVFSWHKLFSPPETIAWSDQGCRTAGIGCIECKAAMADHLIRWIEPIRARRRQYEANPEQVREILHAGSTKARKVARRTMRRVREAIFGRSARLARAAKTASGAAPKAQGALGS